MTQKRSFSYLKIAAIASCFLCAFAPASVRAEGSNDLVSSGGNRPYLEFRNDTNGGILRRTVMKVYANEGETINLGSSAVGIGSGVINYREPDGTAGSCGTGADGGLIADRNQEVAGPGDGTGGTFIPCVVTVGAGQSGIWEIDFVSPNPASGANPPVATGTAAWTQQSTSGLVTAWDITVRSAAGIDISGRAYANYYAFNMGSNGLSLSSAFTVLTRAGYQYRVDLNGLDPFGFIFFSNRNGFFDTATGDSIFRSLQFVGNNPGSLPSGFAFHNPNDPDIGIYVTQKTFINSPDSSMPASANSPTGLTWLYQEPQAPPTPTNFAFTGIEGTPGQAGTSPLGGTLSFDSTSQSAFSITLDLNADGIYGNSNDRTFLGRSVIGTNSVFWDGIDGLGVAVRPSTIPYNVQINQYAGEAHFPLIDAEQNNNGIIIERLNQPAGLTSSTEDPFNVYYDDRNTGTDFTLCASGESSSSGSCYGTAPTPRQALLGENSSTGAHEFLNGFGNIRGIDTWVYYPSVDVELSGGIVVKEADLIVDKSVDLKTATPGVDMTLTYTITVTNDGPNDEPGITFQDSVPSVLSNVNWNCSITSGIGSCGAESGSGNTINTTLDLNDQAVATYIVTGDLSPSASGTITNSATAIRNNDITDPDLTNNTDDASTVLNTPPPVGGTLCYAVGDNGDQLVGIDINSGAESLIGSIGAFDVEAIAYWPATGVLYAADGGQLGTLNTNSAAYSLLGSFGSGNGSAGTKTFGDINGLAFQPFTGELYGSVRDATGQDLLIRINPATGAHISDAFGSGVDYLVIQSAATTTFSEIDDLAFDPETGALYAIANQGNSSADTLIQIDPTTGLTTNIGPFGVSDMEGLTAFNDGSLYGTTGDSRRFYSINKTSGTADQVGAELSIDGDYEGVACLVGEPNRITGTVFLDPNANAVFDGGDTGTDNATVRLYRDTNGSGTVDGADVLLVSQNTASGGLFDFLFAANGAFVMDVDTATLPPANSVLTTDNVEPANFGSLLNVTDANNNFGHFTNANLALVKRITAINGVSLTDSVDNPADDNDNHPNWPAGTSGAGISTFLAGAIETPVDPGDEVEYTIYYLATGNTPVTNVKLCDRVPTDTTYQSNSLVFFTNGSTSDLTDFADGDNGEFVAAPTATPDSPCPDTNTNGTVVVNLAPSPEQLPNSTAPGTPSNAFGFIRFRAVVD